jgi:hypothetical protein
MQPLSVLILPLVVLMHPLGAVIQPRAVLILALLVLNLRTRGNPTRPKGVLTPKALT